MNLDRPPGWLQDAFEGLVLHASRKEPVVHLTFDDGPHPVITPAALDILKQYNAQGTFFCLGKNIEAYPAIFQRIIDEGHMVGNHTFSHLNSWSTPLEEFAADVSKAQRLYDFELFRPPYGRIGIWSYNKLKSDFTIVLWDVLSKDYDINLTKEEVLDNVLKGVQNGSIVVFHDSEKAGERMTYALNESLKVLSDQGYKFEGLRPEMVMP